MTGAKLTLIPSSFKACPVVTAHFFASPGSPVWPIAASLGTAGKSLRMRKTCPPSWSTAIKGLTPVVFVTWPSMAFVKALTWSWDSMLRSKRMTFPMGYCDNCHDASWSKVGAKMPTIMSWPTFSSGVIFSTITSAVWGVLSLLVPPVVPSTF